MLIAGTARVSVVDGRLVGGIGSIVSQGHAV